MTLMHIMTEQESTEALRISTRTLSTHAFDSTSATLAAALAVAGR